MWCVSPKFHICSLLFWDLQGVDAVAQRLSASSMCPHQLCAVGYQFKLCQTLCVQSWWSLGKGRFWRLIWAWWHGPYVAVRGGDQQVVEVSSICWLGLKALDTALPLLPSCSWIRFKMEDRGSFYAFAHLLLPHHWCNSAWAARHLQTGSAAKFNRAHAQPNLKVMVAPISYLSSYGGLHRPRSLDASKMLCQNANANASGM